MNKVTVTTSWDDGHVLDVRLATLLKKYNIRGTFYISPKDREFTSEERLTNDQVRELAKDFEIGAHTMTHPRLTDLGKKEAKEEIVSSKEYLEKLLGKPVTSFCYPAGYYAPKYMEMVRRAGFTLGRTVERFTIRVPKDPFSLSTTIHAYRHWSDAWPIFKRVGITKFLSCYLHWDELAIQLFEEASRTGGVFHLWGHSWEIEKNKDWERLERVLEHIALRSTVDYVTNAQLISETKNMQKTVLFVTPYFLPYGGGLERYAFEIASRLQKDYQWRVVIVTSGNCRGRDQVEDYNGLTVYRLSYQFKVSNTPFSFRWFSRAKKILKEENPDIVNIHTPVPGIGDVIAWLIKNKPCVVAYHAGSMHKSHSCLNILVWLYEHTLMRVLLGRADSIVCSSDYVRFQFLEEYVSKSRTITPAVDTSIFKPAPEKKNARPTILFVAGLNRSEQHKGLQILIEAVKILREKIPNIQLTVVGGGNMQSEYELRVKRLGLENSVIFTGRLQGSALVEKYQQAHVFVLSSRNESFSMVALEAMACALPVVSTRVGGITSLIEGGETGFLVEAVTSTDFAEKIAQILLNPKASAVLGKNGNTKAVEQFGWNSRTLEFNTLFLERLHKEKLHKIRILETPVRFYPYIGGVENHIYYLSEQLVKLGYDITVMCANEPKASASESVKGFQVRRLSYTFKIANTNITLGLPRALWRSEFDVIHTHMPTPWSADWSALVARLRKKPLVLTIHNDMDKADLFGKVVTWIYVRTFFRLLLRSAAKIIIVNMEWRTSFKKTSHIFERYGKKVIAIPNGVDTEMFKISAEKTDAHRIL